MDLLELPFNQLVNLTYSPGDPHRLELPFRAELTNHLGDLHAAALYALAEAASARCLQQEFGEVGFPVVPVVRRAEVKYQRPARSTVAAEARLEAESRDAFLDQLSRRGRAAIDVAVTVGDVEGKPVLRANFQWFVAKVTNETSLPA